jgi:hypothetical protein
VDIKEEADHTEVTEVRRPFRSRTRAIQATMQATEVQAMVRSSRFGFSFSFDEHRTWSIPFLFLQQAATLLPLHLLGMEATAAALLLLNRATEATHTVTRPEADEAIGAGTKALIDSPSLSFPSSM